MGKDHFAAAIRSHSRDHAGLLQGFHEGGGAVVTNAQMALDERNGRAAVFGDQLARLAQQRVGQVVVLGIVGAQGRPGFGRNMSPWRSSTCSPPSA